MPPLSLETPHLRLVLGTTADVLARVDALDPADRAQVSPDWLAQMRAAVPSPWTHGFGLRERSSGQAVGSCGFKGPPDGEGTVEVAYAVDSAWRGRGYAKEAAIALTVWALAAGARRVRAHTLPEAGPSTRVLAAAGFHFAGEAVDPDDGPVWRWQFPAG